MPNRRLETVDVRVLLQHLRTTPSDRQVSRETGVARVTVHRYRQWAKENALLTEPLLPLNELHRRLESTLPKLIPPQNLSTVEAYRPLVEQLRKEGVEVRAILNRLKERGYEGSYSSVYRFVQAMEPPVPPDVTVRVETLPAEEAQVDFGEVGRMLDIKTGEVRKAWAFVMVLSYSRHQYVEFVFNQKVETWLLCHVHAFEFFGGSPRRVRIDNLKAAITHAAIDDPEVNRSYAECAEHYNFLILPCRPRTPEHKGKVESGVHYVQRNFIAGREVNGREVNGREVNGREVNGREVNELEAANRDVKRWCLEEAGRRTHGTTKEAPIKRFEETERALLSPLPTAAFDLAVMKKVKLHRDCCVVFEGSYYSAPFRLVGQELWIRGGLTTVKVYDREHQLIATHDRAKSPGERKVHLDHFPANKVPGLTQTRQECLEKAEAIGPCALEVVQEILGDKTLDKLPSAGRLVRMAEKYTAIRVEAACKRAMHFGDPRYTTVKRILAQALDQALDQEPLSSVSGPAVSVTTATAMTSLPVTTTSVSTTAVSTTAVSTFVRSVEELLGHLYPGHANPETGETGLSDPPGGTSWN